MIGRLKLIAEEIEERIIGDISSAFDEIADDSRVFSDDSFPPFRRKPSECGVESRLIGSDVLNFEVGVRESVRVDDARRWRSRHRG